ncbi:MAG: sigma-54-dependent Fis family transcriptional regulator [Planctomycetes bacterium]|nr:sigma-54-dependent Fis family transcriptional regulator [Planctomycetota bacterium]
MGKGSVLIVHADKFARDSVARALRQGGYEATGAGTRGLALHVLRAQAFDALILAPGLPDGDAMDVLVAARARSLEVIVISSNADVNEAVRFVKAGASEYLEPPRSPDLLERLDKLLSSRRLDGERRNAREAKLRRNGVPAIIGCSPAVQRVLNLVEQVIDNHDTTVLIQGESGTGKDLLAKMLHYGGPRAEGPYMNLTCTALSDTLLESELFGHEKGAFTDAKTQKKGLVEIAEGGTLFLDEIGDMRLATQARLLRFLEERAFRRVGGEVDLHVNVRVIAATNRDLEELVERGGFREDLYFRLNVIPITMPPLRERKGDVPLLVKHFLQVFHRETHRPILDIDPTLMSQLEAYRWPGNVRELKNLIERAMVLSSREVLRSVASRKPRAERPAESPFKLPPEGVDLEVLEKDLLCQALRAAGGNQARAGELLGLNRDQVRYRMLKYGMQVSARNGYGHAVEL